MRNSRPNRAFVADPSVVTPGMPETSVIVVVEDDVIPVPRDRSATRPRPPPTRSASGRRTSPRSRWPGSCATARQGSWLKPSFDPGETCPVGMRTRRIVERHQRVQRSHVEAGEMGRPHGLVVRQGLGDQGVAGPFRIQVAAEARATELREWQSSGRWRAGRGCRRPPAASLSSCPASSTCPRVPDTGGGPPANSSPACRRFRRDSSRITRQEGGMTPFLSWKF